MFLKCHLIRIATLWLYHCEIFLQFAKDRHHKITVGEREREGDKTLKEKVSFQGVQNWIELNWTEPIVDYLTKGALNVTQTSMRLVRCTKIMPIVHFHPANHMTFMGFYVCAAHLNVKLRSILSKIERESEKESEWKREKKRKIHTWHMHFGLGRYFHHFGSSPFQIVFESFVLD